MSSYDRELKVVTDAIRGAADKYLSKKPVVKIKESPLGIYDVISDNDILIEDYIKNNIKSEFPSDSFECEESGIYGKTNRRWIIDPIDGTINYVHGIPLYGIQVALVIDNIPVISAMYLPAFNEMYTAQIGCGATLNGKKLNVCKETEMSASLLSIGDFSKGSVEFRENQVRLMDILHDRIGRIKMMGSSCYDFTSFSAGCFDYHVRFIRNMWDFLPGFLLARESGALYDESMLKEHRLLVITTSKKNLKDLCDLIDKEMTWYVKDE